MLRARFLVDARGVRWYVVVRCDATMLTKSRGYVAGFLTIGFEICGTESDILQNL